MDLYNKTFKNKKIVITGHTGFKGSWLTLWLNLLGSEVYGISNNIPSNPSNFEILDLSSKINDLRLDVQDLHSLRETINQIKPDFIFHLAAQSLVKKSYINTQETFMTNTIGTINLLESLRSFKRDCTIVFITSDKVYDNKEWVWGYKENDKIGGADPYSSSKGCAELAISSYFRSFYKDSKNIKLAVARAGNVIGGGDWAENRIVPDCIRSWEECQKVNLRYPKSTRPWQHVLEPLSGYLKLAEYTYNSKIESGEVYNFGPLAEQNRSVEELVINLKEYFPNSHYITSINDDLIYKESKLLKLNCDKALFELNWLPRLNFNKTVEFTAKWYAAFLESKIDMYEFTKLQIEEYSLL